MSTKDTPEEVNEVSEDAEVKPAAKKTVRKTIRRVRKVAAKRDPEEAPAEPSSADAPGEDAAAAEATEKTATGTTDKSEAEPAPPMKRVPKSNQRGTGRKDTRSESHADDESGRSEGRERRGGERRGSGRQRRGGAVRRVVEPVSEKELSKKAWKIYQADIAEEGIALVDDKTGRNLALRSFELARMFLEEEAKQRRAIAAAKSEPREKTAQEKGPKDEKSKDKDDKPGKDESDD